MMRKRTKIILLFILLFPLVQIDSQVKTSFDTKLPVEIRDGRSYYAYTVQPGEGLYRICKNFHAKQEEVIQSNPQLSEGVQAGMILYIPVNEKAAPDMKAIASRTDHISGNNQNITKTSRKIISYKDHEVQRKQTLFAISQLYNLSQEEIRMANPDLEKDKVKKGQILKIPIFSDDTILDTNDTKSLNESVQNSGPATITSGCEFKIAFLLPFMLEQTKIDQTVKRFIEFYSGSVVALNDFKHEGCSFNIYTFDTEKSDNKLAEILEDSTLLDMDLIVGPAYSNQVSMISDYARKNHIKVLIPFSSRIVDLGSNPYLFQFNPGTDYEVKAIEQVINSHYHNANIILASSNMGYVAEDNNNLLSLLNTSLETKNIACTKVDLNDTVRIDSFLVSDRLNLIFFNTTKINQLSSVLAHLNDLSKSMDIAVYQPMSWLNSKVKMPKNFTVSPFKNTFNDNLYLNYQAAYFKLFKYEPDAIIPRYDILGYDLMNYAVPNILKNNLTEKLNLPFMKGLQSDIELTRLHSGSGFINQKLQVLGTDSIGFR